MHITDDELTDWFAHHPPANPDIVEAHQKIRAEYAALAVSMNRLLPEGPDKKIALRSIREAMYHANACIAIAQAVHEPAA